jgi:hypothetical protein
MGATAAGAWAEGARSRELGAAAAFPATEASSTKAVAVPVFPRGYPTGECSRAGLSGSTGCCWDCCCGVLAGEPWLRCVPAAPPAPLGAASDAKAVGPPWPSLEAAERGRCSWRPRARCCCCCCRGGEGTEGASTDPAAAATTAAPVLLLLLPLEAACLRGGDASNASAAVAAA